MHVIVERLEAEAVVPDIKLYAVEGGRASRQHIDAGSKEEGRVDVLVNGVAENSGDMRREVTCPVVAEVLDAA